MMMMMMMTMKPLCQHNSHKKGSGVRGSPEFQSQKN